MYLSFNVHKIVLVITQASETAIKT